MQQKVQKLLVRPCNLQKGKGKIGQKLRNLWPSFGSGAIDWQILAIKVKFGLWPVVELTPFAE